MKYLDTSLVVAALANETRSQAVQAWLGGQDATELAISDWVTTEVSSALSLKLRAGQIGSAARAAALSEFNRLTTETFQVLGVSASHFRAAAQFADQSALGLRAGDALHLAIAAGRGATLCTLDRRMAEAGSALGLLTQLI